MQKNYKAKYVIQNSETILENFFIEITDNIITNLTNEAVNDSEVIDLGNVAIMPGFVNAHTHVGLVSVKGLGHSTASALYDVMWGIEPHLNEDDVIKLSKLGILDCLSSGTTSINDHYFFSEGVATAAIEMGIRGFIGHTVMTEYGPWLGDEQISMAESFIKNFIHEPLIHPTLAPHATDTTNPKILMYLKDIAESNNLPIHIHLSQTKIEYDYTKKNFGLSPIKHAKKIGFLDKNVIAAHCNVVEDGDIDILVQSGAYPIFCPSTHALGGKLMDTNKIINLDGVWGIGTDCSGGNDDYEMIEESRIALYINNSKNLDTKMSPKQIFDISTNQNFQKLNLNSDMSPMEVGSYADFISIDLSNEKMQPLHDLVNNVVLSASAREVNDVIIDGKEIIRDKEFLNADKYKIINEANEVLDRLLIKSNFRERIKDGEFS